MSTSGDVQYIRGYHEYIGGYHEYIRGCSVHVGDIIIHVGGYHEYIGGCSVHQSLQYKSKAFMNLLPHMNCDITRCTEHPLMHSRYPQVLMVSP